MSDEIRDQGVRVGFRIECLDGQSAVLAHTEIQSGCRLSKYGVDLPALERLSNNALKIDPKVDVYLVDEIGPIECFSRTFVEAIEKLIESDWLVVATIHNRAGGAVSEIKQRADVELWELTPENRDSFPDSVLKWIDQHRDCMQ